MTKLTIDLIVTEQRFDTFGPRPSSVATVPYGPVSIGDGQGMIEGGVTFHGLDIGIGQIITAEFTLTDKIYTGKREAIVGRRPVPINELP